MLHVVMGKLGWDLIGPDGIILENETLPAVDAVKEAIEHPSRWEPTEAYEIAEAYTISGHRRRPKKERIWAWP